jgi:hypothetical protein
LMMEAVDSSEFFLINVCGIAIVFSGHVWLLFLVYYSGVQSRDILTIYLWQQGDKGNNKIIELRVNFEGWHDKYNKLIPEIILKDENKIFTWIGIYVAMSRTNV